MSKFNKHIIIVGSARSGTSWLAETIAKQHRYRLLFEPDHEFQTPKGALICDKWIRSSSQSPKAASYLNKVFANRVDSDWIAQNSNRKWKRHLWPIIPKKFVIKFVRTNLMAKYMEQEFDIPVLHLLRNPYDTIASQHRVKFPWLYDLSHFEKQAELVAFVDTTFDFNLKKTDTLSEIEKLTVRWCLENVIPIEIQKIESEHYKIVRHEALRADSRVFREICHQFDLDPIDNLETVYGLPSSKTHPKSEVISKKSKSDLFSPADYQKINEVLSIFNTQLYPLKESKL